MQVSAWLLKMLRAVIPCCTGELPLAPLVEALGADNLLLLFAAVLLERRVLLRARQAWLLTLTAEGIMRLLYPFTWQHVYIPVMPHSLTEYLEVCVYVNQSA